MHVINLIVNDSFMHIFLMSFLETLQLKPLCMMHYKGVYVIMRYIFL